MTDHPSALVSVPVEDLLFFKLKDLITEQSEGEWTDEMIVKDAHHFANQLRPALAAAPAAPQAAGVGEDELIERGLRTIRAYDTVRYLRDALSATTARLTGYDWNADPDGVTKQQADAFSSADRVFADLDAAVASHPEIELPECQTCGGNGKIEEAARTEGANQHSACVRTCDDCDGCGFASNDEPEALRAPSREPEGGAVATWHPLDENGLAEVRVNGRRVTSMPSYPGALEVAERINVALATREEAPAGAGEIAGPDSFSAEGKFFLAVDYLTLMTWRWGESCGIDNIGWDDTGDSYNQSCRDDHRKARRAVVDAFHAAVEEKSALRAQPQAREDAQPVAYGADHQPWCQPGDQTHRAFRLRFEDPDMREMVWTGPDAEREALAAYNQYAPAWNVYLFSGHARHPAPDALWVAVEALEPFAAHPDFHAGDDWPVTFVNDEERVPGVTAGDFRRAARALAALQAEQKGGA